MTSSRSNASINKLLLVVGAVLLVTGLGLRTAGADRKRVVILPFDGVKAQKFHAAMVRLVKKSHSVVSKAKWESIAEDMGATRVNDNNVKKVAKKMKVDGVIEGVVSKRRDEYLLKLKLRDAKDGSVTATASVKSESLKLDKSAAKEIKDELIAAIDNLESGGDDDDAKPAKKGKKDDDDDDDDAKTAKKDKKKKVKKGKKDDDDDDDDDAKTAKKGSKFGNGQMKKDDDDGAAALKTKKDKDDDDDDDKKSDKKAKKKKVAKKDDDGEEIEKKAEPEVKMDSAMALSAGNRAIDATLGVSLTTRRLSWQSDGDLPSSADAGPGNGRPPNYKGVPAPGAILDITAYPLAFGHKNTGITKDIGVTVLYDKALLISSEAGGEKLTTKAQRYAVGAVFRYPLGKGATAPVVGGALRYGAQLFSIEGADLPNVNYKMISPGVFFKLPLGKIQLNVAANYMLVSKSGQMESTEQYGGDKMSGFDIDAGADYALTKNLFARGALRFESITHKFDGTGMLTTMRDSDPEQDVQGAKDTYIGLAFTVGYLY